MKKLLLLQQILNNAYKLCITFDLTKKFLRVTIVLVIIFIFELTYQEIPPVK